MRAIFIPCMKAVLSRVYCLFPEGILVPKQCFDLYLVWFVQVWEGGVSGEWAGRDHLHSRLRHTPEPSGVSALARQHAKSQPWVSLWIRLNSFLLEAESKSEPKVGSVSMF